MSTKDHRKAKSQKEVAQIELVQELYSLSDSLFGMNSDGHAASGLQTEMARQRLQELIAQEQKNSMYWSQETNHSWVLAVLVDLGAYAISQNLQELEADLLRTKVRFEEYLKENG
ncbi:hypothetical protein [uncultured Tateyamaria sp.]|uniref:hypothetical protein n=1 Tax=uncultured Tateyamaria sp. TaxID=455651 RepID=UPI00262EF579|nr:hypothetical protein [uncultured Tateyamaria sp.]